MVHTDLLKEILTNAQNIQAEYGAQHLCASHIAAAVADFCKTPYTGFAFSTYHYPRFEDERVRYLFAKTVKLSPYFRQCISRHARNHVAEEAFDLAHCEEIASAREAKILSADVVFLCALKALQPPYTANLKAEITENLLQDVDTNIYDYVIEKIDSICAQLQKKSEEARALRDWKPAPKFAEPEALAAMFLEKIEKENTGSILTLKFPKFFGASDLKVSIHKADDVYYIHDNGCAIRHLSRRVDDKEKCHRILKKVCHPRWIVSGKVTGCFCASYTFFYYLQRLAFIAHADLYYTKASRLMCGNDKSYAYVSTKKAEPMDETALINLLKAGIGFDYEENQGLYCWLDAKCSLSTGRSAFQIEPLEDGYIRISDRRKGKYEGEIFEQFYWDNDDIAPYGKFITKIADRFGAEFDGKNISLTDKAENVCKALYRFFNLATLLSEFGHDIDLPKLRQKR